MAGNTVTDKKLIIEDIQPDHFTIVSFPNHDFQLLVSYKGENFCGSKACSCNKIFNFYKKTKRFKNLVRLANIKRI